MPAPYRGPITGRMTDGELIRADKDQFIARLYARLGPEEFYRRRLAWLAAHGRWTSYHRLIAYVERAGIDILPHT
jgi:hypothetical protein